MLNGTDVRCRNQDDRPSHDIWGVPMLLIITGLLTLAVLAIVAVLGRRGDPNAPNLGWMSEQWLTEHRAVHSGAVHSG